MISDPGRVTTPPGSLLHVIEREHCAEMCLCNMLERLADALPEPLDAQMASAGIATLRNCVRRHIVLEETHLYPVLMKRAKPGEFAQELLNHISHEHACDESLAHDTADQMAEALTLGRVPMPEMLGYMLRGFFESRRRHIAWEDAIMLPLARRRLLEPDFAPFSITEFEEALGSDPFTGLTNDKEGCCSRSDEA